MNVLTCQQVEEHLDLLAAGECTRPTRRAVEQHLDRCPTCAARYAASQRLQGLLELHWHEAAQLQRLHERLDEAARPPRRLRLLVGPWMKRAAALAALLLVTFGLTLLLPRRNDSPAGEGLTVTLVALRGVGGQEALKTVPASVREAQPPARLEANGLLWKLPEDRRGAKYRRLLQQRQRRDDLPLPPPLPVGLELTNNGLRPLDVHLGETALDVQGPGVLRLAAGANALLAPRPSQTLRLAPGQRRWLPVERLVAGSPGHVEYVYLTEPGDYTLTVRVRAVIDREPGWLTSGPLRIHVRDE